MRSALLITTLLACSAAGWFAFNAGADVVITNVHRLVGRADTVKNTLDARNQDSSNSRLQGALPQFLTGYDRHQGAYDGYRDSEVMGDEQNKSSYYFWQIVSGVAFYFLVASKYPQLQFPNERSARIMEEPTCFRINTGPICLQSCFCQNPMLAHLLHATGSLNYWVALVISMFAPCCLVLGATHFLDTDAKLGAPQRKGLFTHALEACFCSCCVIAQSNEALDAATGMELGFCSVKQSQGQQYAVHDPAVPGVLVATPYQALPAQALRPSAPPYGA